MKIEKRKVERAYKKLVKKAEVKDVDTGTKRERTVIQKNGERVIEEVPVFERKFYEAVFEDAVLVEDRFIVKTKIGKGKEEEHEFANEEDAKRFINDTNRDLNRG